MRVVLDTNIVVSALLWGGVPYRLLVHAQMGVIELVTSPTLIAELNMVLARTHLGVRVTAQNMTVDGLVAQYQALAHIITPQFVPAIVANDPDDDHVLACAVEGGANLIVSGDKHLLNLGGQYLGIPIARAGDALRIIEVAE